MFFNTKKRIEKGISLLDKRYPDWHYRINLGQLDMMYSQSCVLGQLFGSYELGAAKLDLHDWSAYSHGFLPLVQVGRDLGELFPWVLRSLAKSWRKQIIQKRKEEERFFQFLKHIDAFGKEIKEREREGLS